ncbi:hypothetical protein M9H77_22376 [Catharanthus roseus]|uniref:Uncharacterized protein n=1 Tax=Catharanthus roseus TaxID=4058 RepID=A0ACC0AUC7_CATRO|nr:hypothetical protein M9H77_22376 [Catharanthus roseus]
MDNLKKQHDNPSSFTGNAGFQWRKIWDLYALPRVKMTVWRWLPQSLPTKATLWHRKIIKHPKEAIVDCVGKGSKQPAADGQIKGYDDNCLMTQHPHIPTQEKSLAEEEEEEASSNNLTT